MDAVSALSGGGVAPAAEKGFGALDSDEFTKLILTELGNQDPLEPNDTGALLEQLATIRSIESDTKLNSTLSAMTDRADFMGAAGLIGQRVTTTEGESEPRTVVSVLQGEGGVSVRLGDGAIVPLSSVTSVFGAEESSEQDEESAA